MARYRKLDVLPVADWPKEDRRLWDIAAAPGDQLRCGGIISGWRPVTKWGAQKAYGRFLYNLAEFGLLDPTSRPSQRIGEKCLRPFVMQLSGHLAPQSVGRILDTISMTVRAMEPGADRAIIKQVAAWMNRNAEPRMVKSGRVVSPADLYGAGLNWMQAARLQCDPKKRSAQFRDGLAVALMALCPLRVGVFSSLRLQENIVQVQKRIRIQIDKEYMKTPKSLDVPFPSELLPNLADYLRDFRPCLHESAQISPYLWLNLKGQQLSEGRMRQQFYEVTQAQLGITISPHLFRDAAATFIYDMMPDRALMAASVLQHSNFKTTEQHYIAGQQRSAASNYYQAIGDLLGGME